MTASSEHELVGRARRGDAHAVAELFDAHWHGAWRVAVGVSGDPTAAEDIAQEAFIRGIRGLGGFDGRRPFAVWLHRIVVNTAIDHMRRERRRPDVSQPLAAGDGPAPPDGGVPELHAALLALSDEQRAVVFLHFWVGHTVDEVAVVLGVARGTVRSRLARAMTALRAHPDLQAIARVTDV